MKLKIGDRVLVLDEDFSGVVKEIEGTTVSIETEDGFCIDFNENELVKSDHTIKANMFQKTNLKDVISEKEQSKKRRSNVKKRTKDRYEPTMEVDLHIHQLVSSYRGMANHDILTLQLDTARRKLDFAISKRIQKIVFIHGVGEGVLKLELEYLFGRYNNIKFYDADYKKYGLGATEVYIFQNAARD
ncbi:DNA mismatch repair protein MutS [Tamlana fucoidanivorans]|uniref:DNA mismatch repair protein MutS n=1 Tax=Allotamlana fucoidanivorans TaxID=2583814 RepID=A0A5C4SFS8_9FLAO|nr:DNA mismatch repair protein MutS [Tamlana fucoidanivorans]TNJ42163.1 DNA mismatch repair protein MutS [Tamlana fucoidanivorans]